MREGQRVRMSTKGVSVVGLVFPAIGVASMSYTLKKKKTPEKDKSLSILTNISGTWKLIFHEHRAARLGDVTDHEIPLAKPANKVGMASRGAIKHIAWPGQWGHGRDQQPCHSDIHAFEDSNMPPSWCSRGATCSSSAGPGLSPQTPGLVLTIMLARLKEPASLKCC